MVAFTSSASTSSSYVGHALPDLSGHLVSLDFCPCGAGVHELVLSHPLGEGGYGVVYAASDLASASPHTIQYAVKAVPLPDGRAQRARCLRMLRAEADTYRRVGGHANVVGVHGVTYDVRARAAFLVLDLCAGGDLFDLVTAGPGLYGNDDRVRKLLLGLVDALEACHKRGVYHRDVKLENVLLGADGRHPYLADFGLATTDAISTKFGAGSTGYMAPESFNDGTAATYACAPADIWSFGMVAFNVLTGRMPWDAAAPHDPAFAAYCLRPRSYFRHRFALSPAADALLRAALRLEPARRPGWTELRAALQSADTFFLSEEQLRASAAPVRAVADAYMPREEEIRSQDVNLVVWEGCEAPPCTPIGEDAPRELVPLSTTTDDQADAHSDSESDSDGPITPQTHAAAAGDADDVPPLELSADAHVCGTHAGKAGAPREHAGSRGGLDSALCPLVGRVDVS